MSAEPYVIDNSLPAPVSPEADLARKTRGLWAWSLADGLIALLLITVLSVPLVLFFLYQDGALGLGLGSNAFNDAANKVGTSLQTNPYRFFASFVIQDGILLAVVLLRLRVLRNLPWRWFGITTARLRRNLLIGVGVGIATFVINVILSEVLQYFGQTPNQAALFPIRANDPVGQSLVFVAGALIAPVVEEVFFRGYIFKAWLERWGPAIAYVVSALIFTLPHLPGITEGKLGLAVPIYAIGLLLAWSFHWTGSLVPGIVAHIMNNSLGLAQLIACTNNPNLNCN